ncbi:MAG: helix-turn-helix domain-containing protein [Taibaiella sp.]|nr:helix-turn-helix domain-containing protein [Taibaiella sp.]
MSQLVVVDVQVLTDIITKAVRDGLQNHVKLLKELPDVPLPKDYNSLPPYKNHGEKSVASKEDETIFLTRSECAKLLRVSKTTLDNWRNLGYIPFSKLNSRVRFEKEVILKLAKEDLFKKFRERK